MPTDRKFVIRVEVRRSERWIYNFRKLKNGYYADFTSDLTTAQCWKYEKSASKIALKLKNQNVHVWYKKYCNYYVEEITPIKILRFEKLKKINKHKKT